MAANLSNFCIELFTDVSLIECIFLHLLILERNILKNALNAKCNWLEKHAQLIVSVSMLETTMFWYMNYVTT